MEYKVHEDGNEWFYHGLIVASIDYKDAPVGEYKHTFSSKDDEGNVVEEVTYKYMKPILFSEMTTGKESWKHKGDSEGLEDHNDEFEDAASFLYNVKKVSQEKDEVTDSIKYTYLADKITTEEAKAIFDKDQPGCVPFFAVHGFNTEARGHINGCSKGTFQFKNEGSNNIVIPTIWPSRGHLGPRAYRIDRGEFVPEAAIEFEKLIFQEQVKPLNVFPEKNLMCHSMGNYLLRKAANENIKFDNIFMVAADVRHNLFDKEYIARFDRTGSRSNPNADEGLNIIKMLKKGEDNKPIGKICALTNWEDEALKASTAINYLNRLGQAGMGTRDKWVGGWEDKKSLLHPDIQDHFHNKNVLKDFLKGDPDTPNKEHNYQWKSHVVKYYIEQINNSKKQS